MMGKQHIIFGTITGAGTYLLLNQIAPQFTENTIWYFGGILLGSLSPDIDTETSTLGHLVSPIAKLINKLFGHRTITHDVLLWSIIAIISILLKPITFGFWFGYLGHLFLDCFTVNGIMWGYFFHKKYTKSKHRDLMMFSHGFIHLLPYRFRMKSSGTAAKLFTYFIAIMFIYGIYLYSNYINVDIFTNIII